MHLCYYSEPLWHAMKPRKVRSVAPNSVKRYISYANTSIGRTASNYKIAQTALMNIELQISTVNSAGTVVHINLAG